MTDTKWPTLPLQARLPINHCNLPSIILGSITFQRHPLPIYIDGIRELHRDLFHCLDVIEQPQNRAQYFMDYMVVRFRLEMLEEAGYSNESKLDRRKANYINTVRGWFFDSNSREAAVLKGWVESRFGLTPRFHHQIINDLNSEAYRRFNQERSEGLYNTNALESQLDLLYSYCQYELTRQYQHKHFTLYRGCNQIEEYIISDQPKNKVSVLLLNNINSFSTSAERADEFGDHVIKVDVPFSKILITSTLLPGLLKGEEEMLVIGGLYETEEVS